MFNINQVTQNEYNAVDKEKNFENKANKFQLFLIGMRVFGVILLELFKTFLKLFTQEEPVKISGKLALVTGESNVNFHDKKKF